MTAAGLKVVLGEGGQPRPPGPARHPSDGRSPSIPALRRTDVTTMPRISPPSAAIQRWLVVKAPLGQDLTRPGHTRSRTASAPNVGSAAIGVPEASSRPPRERCGDTLSRSHAAARIRFPIASGHRHMTRVSIRSLPIRVHLSGGTDPVCGLVRHCASLTVAITHWLSVITACQIAAWQSPIRTCAK